MALHQAVNAQRMSGQLFCTSTPLSVSPGVGLTDFCMRRRRSAAGCMRGYGLVGLGRLLTLSAPPTPAESVSTPPRRIEQLRQAWRHEVGQASWVDQVRRPGSGPLALGAITF